MNIQSRRLIKFFRSNISIALSSAFVLCAALAGTDIVYPTPETQSTFIKDYTPTEVFARFSLEGSQQSGPGGSSAGRGCAFHQKEFLSLLVVAQGNEPVVMEAVRLDLKSRLSQDGSRILAEKGNLSEKLQFDYATTRSKGTVVVDPLTIIDPVLVGGPGGIEPGNVAIRVHIRIVETWYKSSEKACKKL